MKLEHIAVAVPSLEQALQFYRDTLGMVVVGFQDIPGEKVRVAILALGDTRRELLEPTADDSPISHFLDKHGGGIHHIALEVEKLDERVKGLEKSGVWVLPGKSEKGASGHRYAFLHPSSCGGVLVELVEAPVEAKR